MSEMDLATVLGADAKALELAGEVVEITPLKLGQLPRFSRAVAGIAHLFPAEGQVDYLKVLTEGGEDVQEALVIALDRPREWVAELDLADALRAIAAIIEVNTDFFIRHVEPELNRITRLGQTLGRTSSSG